MYFLPPPCPFAATVVIVITYSLLGPSRCTVYCTVQRECGPEGWLQGNKVTDDDDVLIQYCTVEGGWNKVFVLYVEL